MDELPFVCPRSAYFGAESQFASLNCESKVDFCPFRGPGAPFCAAWIVSRKLGAPSLSRSVRRGGDFDFRTSTPVPSQSINAGGKSRYNHSKDSFMDKFVIRGGEPLLGTVRVSGAKNAALPC